jgi:hypothetical protein
MKNVEMTVEGNILINKVDLAKNFGPSSSKKSITIASTEGIYYPRFNDYIVTRH